MSGLKIYRDAGVDRVLLDAASLLRTRGLAKGLRIDPTSGSVDIVAALGLACGAKETELFNSVTNVDFRVAPAHEARYFMALEVLDAHKRDFEMWADGTAVEVKEVVALLTESADRLQRAIV